MFAPSGSRAIIAALPGRIDRALLPEAETLKNVKVDVRECSILKRHVLEDLVEEDTSCIVLIYDYDYDDWDADDTDWNTDWRERLKDRSEAMALCTATLKPAQSWLGTFRGCLMRQPLNT